VSIRFGHAGRRCVRGLWSEDHAARARLSQYLAWWARWCSCRRWKAQCCPNSPLACMAQSLKTASAPSMPHLARARCSRSFAEVSSCSSAAGSLYNEAGNTDERPRHRDTRQHDPGRVARGRGDVGDDETQKNYNRGRHAQTASNDLGAVGPFLLNDPDPTAPTAMRPARRRTPDLPRGLCTQLQVAGAPAARTTRASSGHRR
jgi:hypothetical protein